MANIPDTYQVSFCGLVTETHAASKHVD